MAGWLAFGEASTRSYCGGGNYTYTCPAELRYSFDEGRTFLSYILPGGVSSAPATLLSEKYRIAVTNDAIYFLNGGRVYNSTGSTKYIDKLFPKEGRLISVNREEEEKREKEFARLFELEWEKRGLPAYKDLRDSTMPLKDRSKIQVLRFDIAEYLKQ